VKPNWITQVKRRGVKQQQEGPKVKTLRMYVLLSGKKEAKPSSQAIP